MICFVWLALCHWRPASYTHCLVGSGLKCAACTSLCLHSGGKVSSVDMFCSGDRRFEFCLSNLSSIFGRSCKVLRVWWSSRLMLLSLYVHVCWCYQVRVMTKKCAVYVKPHPSIDRRNRHLERRVSTSEEWVVDYCASHARVSGPAKLDHHTFQGYAFILFLFLLFGMQYLAGIMSVIQKFCLWSTLVLPIIPSPRMSFNLWVLWFAGTFVVDTSPPFEVIGCSCCPRWRSDRWSAPGRGTRGTQSFSPLFVLTGSAPWRRISAASSNL